VNRTTLSLIACTAALAAVTGFAAFDSPDAAGAKTTGAGARLPVERTTLVCPAPSDSDIADTTYTSFTPVTQGTPGDGTAQLKPATEQQAGGTGDSGDGSEDGDGKGKDGDGKGDDGGKAATPDLKPEQPGTPVTSDVSGGSAPALVGTADGRFAPGWTVQETTEIAAGTGRGLLGVDCTAPDTDFWFPGASTSADRTDYVHLTNPDDSAAVVDIDLYGKDGAVKSTLGEGITVPPHSTEPVLLSTLSDSAQDDLTVHVSVRSGRVGAAVQALDDKLGGDWLAAAADAADTVVLPGIPKDATSVRLIVFSSADADTDLKVQLASPSGLITPAGHDTVHIKGGTTTAVDLGDLTRGQAGSLVLTQNSPAVPVMAALWVIRGKGDKQESAFIPATAPLTTRATAAGNSAEGATLSLTAPTATAQVKVTASAGSDGGTEVSKTYTVQRGTTQDITPPVPDGLKGSYALTVQRLSGGPVYGARTLTSAEDGVAGVTTQTLPDDGGTVAVPQADQDVSVLQQ
jgi:hypothetical protein